MASIHIFYGNSKKKSAEASKRKEHCHKVELTHGTCELHVDTLVQKIRKELGDVGPPGTLDKHQVVEAVKRVLETETAGTAKEGDGSKSSGKDLKKEEEKHIEIQKGSGHEGDEAKENKTEPKEEKKV